MVPIRQPNVVLQHPFWGDVSVQLPVPEAPLFSWSAKNRLGGARSGRIRLGTGKLSWKRSAELQGNE